MGEANLRHEHTRAAPRADRLNLMRATRAQLSPVFGMISDPKGRLTQWLQAPQVPAVDLLDQEGTRQIFWPITDTNTIAELQEFLAPCDVVIADGHHRYETALVYRDERHNAIGDASHPQPCDYVLMYLGSGQDTGLVILPTHRVISAEPRIDTQTLLTRLALDFDITPAANSQSLASAIRRITAISPSFGLYLGRNSRWVLRLRDSQAAQQPESLTGGADLAELDVSVFQHLISEPCYHIDTDGLAQSERVRYTIFENEACDWVDAGQAQAAFILNPTSLQQVWQAARNLVTMPQKSTYFYPKLLTGLVIHALD